jgi:nitrogenase subunit NifH
VQKYAHINNYVPPTGLPAHINRIEPCCRQSIRGSAGVGKSTLAQRVKALLASARLYSTPDAVALGHADGADEVCVRILSYVYETLLAAAQENGALAALEKDETVQSTRQLVRVFRETTGLSGGISVQ